MDFNEEFEKEWKEALDEYETIPDKSKIDKLDREFARGYYYCLWCLDNVIHNYKDEMYNSIDSFDKIVEEIVEKYDKYTKDFLKMDFDELLTSILDDYVE
jgi:hypothetical protein